MQLHAPSSTDEGFTAHGAESLRGFRLRVYRRSALDCDWQKRLHVQRLLQLQPKFAASWRIEDCGIR